MPHLARLPPWPTVVPIVFAFALSWTPRAYAEKYGHVSGGVVGAPVLLRGKDDHALYLGLSLLPELRISVSLSDEDYWRLFIAGRWTHLTLLGTAQKDQSSPTPFDKASNLEAMFAFGASVRVFDDGADNKHQVTTAAKRLSFTAGYGNFKYRDQSSSQDTFVEGPFVAVSLDLDAVSFNF